MEDHILDNGSDGGVEELHGIHAEPSIMASITVWAGSCIVAKFRHVNQGIQCGSLFSVFCTAH
jgi:hypothetical protein